jgi:hypothetical protein
MTNRLRMIPGMTMGKVICGVVIFFMLATSAYGTAVQVINFPALMSMVQKMVTQAITDKIKAVWNEEVKVKLEPGTINTKAVSFLKYNISSFTDKMVSQYMKNNAGAFARGDGKLFAETAKSKTAPTIPSANSDFKEFQKKIREVSILLAGAPGGGTDRMKHFTTAEYAAVKLRDVFNQASVAAYEKASEGCMWRKDSVRIYPLSILRISMAQIRSAVKDLAKLPTTIRSPVRDTCRYVSGRNARALEAGRMDRVPALHGLSRYRHHIARSDVWFAQSLCGCSPVSCRHDATIAQMRSMGCVFQTPTALLDERRNILLRQACRRCVRQTRDVEIFRSSEEATDIGIELKKPPAINSRTGVADMASTRLRMLKSGAALTHTLGEKAMRRPRGGEGTGRIPPRLRLLLQHQHRRCSKLAYLGD